jgi:uncharacterized membrane protein
MAASGTSLDQCQICHRKIEREHLVSGDLIHGPVLEAMVAEHPAWSADGYVCLPDLNRYRTQHVRAALEAERGELTHLEKEVLESLREQELLSRNVNREFDQESTFGERVADRVAEFGGSWRFIISFGCFLALWIALNSIALLRRPWDPYPYILLNLILSCIAALQAPVIMMSQNRQEAKDRIRAENDYQVNLKAELEIRSLHAKLDLLLTHQWQRLLEIQEIQTEMMQELLEQKEATSSER